MINCKFCGQQNADDATYCAGCKRPLPAGAATAAQPLTGAGTSSAAEHGGARRRALYLQGLRLYLRPLR